MREIRVLQKTSPVKKKIEVLKHLRKDVAGDEGHPPKKAIPPKKKKYKKEIEVFRHLRKDVAGDEGPPKPPLPCRAYRERRDKGTVTHERLRRSSVRLSIKALLRRY